MIQFGSILAVLFLYFHKLNPFSPRKSGREKAENLQLWSKVVVAAIPAGVVGILFNDVIDRVLSVWYVIALALIVYGVLFIVLEKRNRRRPARISSIGEMGYGTAFWIGVVQIWRWCRAHPVPDPPFWVRSCWAAPASWRRSFPFSWLCR